ncbi:MAG: hypothetical protein Q7R90_00390 [bacterium]|nr:hypothetical protein [bacterium]
MNETFIFVAFLLAFALLAYVIHRAMRKTAVAVGNNTAISQNQFVGKSQRTAKLLIEFVALLFAFALLKAPALYFFPFGMLGCGDAPCPEQNYLLYAIGPVVFLFVVLGTANVFYRKQNYTASVAILSRSLIYGLILQVVMNVIMPQIPFHLIW